MRAKNIIVRIKSLEDVLDEAKGVMQKLERGEKVKKHEGISSESLEAMRKALTEERLRILKTIKREHPQSIYELAKLLGRDIKNTFDDVQFLTQVGLVELKKTKRGRERERKDETHGELRQDFVRNTCVNSPFTLESILENYLNNADFIKKKVYKWQEERAENPLTTPGL